MISTRNAMKTEARISGSLFTCTSEVLLEKIWSYEKRLKLQICVQNICGLISIMTCALEGALKESGIFDLEGKD